MTVNCYNDETGKWEESMEGSCKDDNKTFILTNNVTTFTATVYVSSFTSTELIARNYDSNGNNLQFTMKKMK